MLFTIAAMRKLSAGCDVHRQRRHRRGRSSSASPTRSCARRRPHDRARDPRGALRAEGLGAMAARRAVLVLNPASANGSTGKLAEGLVGDLGPPRPGGAAAAHRGAGARHGADARGAAGRRGAGRRGRRRRHGQRGRQRLRRRAGPAARRAGGAGRRRARHGRRLHPHATASRRRSRARCGCSPRAGTRRIDVGRLTCQAADGEGELTRLFANHASCGLTGDVATRANALVQEARRHRRLPVGHRDGVRGLEERPLPHRRSTASRATWWPTTSSA